MHILQKGENAFLSSVMPNVSSINIAINWIKKPTDKTEFDIDASAFLLNERKKVRTDADFIFYNQSESSDKAIQLKAQGSERQLFTIVLDSVANEVKTIAFVLTLHEAYERQQNFSQLEKIRVTVSNATDSPFLAYTVDDASIETAFILLEIYRYNSDWKIRAVGQGFSEGLELLARNFGVEIDNNPPTNENYQPTINSEVEPANNPAVLRYIQAIKPHITRYQEKLTIAKSNASNESRTRLLIDSLLMSILGYTLEHIRTEYKIPNRNTRADYMLSLNGKDSLVIEAKAISETLKTDHVSQVTAYAYYTQIDFALLTNGIHWQLYYVERKQLKKYKAHHVFSIDLSNFDDKVGERLFSISRYGLEKHSFEEIKLKMNALNNIAEVMFDDEIIEHITTLMNRRYEGCLLTTDDVLNTLENLLN